jgi:RNA polymerase sigma-70 factor (ECF subfamily)
MSQTEFVKEGSWREGLGKPTTAAFMSAQRAGIVRRFQQGEANAFQALYFAYRPSALRSAARVTRDPGLAEDAVQEAFIRGLRDIGDLRRPEAFGGWLNRLIQHSAADQVRGRRSELSLTLASECAEDWNRNRAFQDPVEDALASERDAAIVAALTRLDPRSRAIVVLRFYAGLTDREIALLTDLPLGTIKSRLSRSLSKLAAALHREAWADQQPAPRWNQTAS